MSGATFLQGLGFFFNHATSGNATNDSVCVSNVDHYQFYQFTLIPAVVLTVLMASTRTRRQKLLNFLDGRPGLLFPMDTLTRSSRISYCCAFGATGFLVYQILLESKFAIDYHGPIALKSLIAILSMFIYGMVFFPVFASLALGTAFSFGLGSLYTWMFFVIEVYRLTECDLNAKGRALVLARAVPSILCLAYLSVSLPIRFGIACYHRKFFTSNMGEDLCKETVEEIKQSYQGQHVRKLLQKPVIEDLRGRPKVGAWNKVKALVLGILSKVIYQRQKGFRYPSRLMSVMFVAFCVVYVLTVEFLTSCLTLLYYILDALDLALNEIGMEEQPNEDENTTNIRTALYIAQYLTEILRVSVIVSITLACAISFLTILHMMTSFRTNLYDLYRGDYSQIPPPSSRSAANLLVGSIKYAGFQVAYIVWAYVITVVILLIICIALAALITLLLVGITDWLVNKILQVWPSILIAIILLIVQRLLAMFVFLQDRGQHLRLDNRRSYFVFTYLMFFYNIFLGLFSCLLRILKAIGVGTIFLARLDNSTLPRKFEFFDPGFSAYQGYIHMEVAHTHPVVNVFIRLLSSLSSDRKAQKNETSEIEIPMETYTKLDRDSPTGDDSTDVPKSRPVNVAARFNWHVTYTLLHNPAIRIYRKGFIQAIRKAKKEGLKVPISDRPITDFDLVKSQEEREKERQEEARKIRLEQSHGLSHGLTAISGGLGRDEEEAMTKYTDKTGKKNKIRTWIGKKLKKKKVDSSSGYEECDTKVKDEEDLEADASKKEADQTNENDDDNVSQNGIYIDEQRAPVIV